MEKPDKERYHRNLEMGANMGLWQSILTIHGIIFAAIGVLKTSNNNIPIWAAITAFFMTAISVVLLVDCFRRVRDLNRVRADYFARLVRGDLRNDSKRESEEDTYYKKKMLPKESKYTMIEEYISTGLLGINFLIVFFAVIGEFPF